MTTILRISDIRTDGGTQPREQINYVTASEYAEAMQAGAVFPPVVVFYDGTCYWLADGFHRVRGAQEAGHSSITADVRQGTVDDARWYSFGANQAHGLRRTNDDKRRAVEAALRHPYASKHGDRDIARHVGVDHKTVGVMRDRLSGEIPQMDQRIVTRNGTTYTMDTTNIGKAAIEDDNQTTLLPPAPAPRVALPDVLNYINQNPLAAQLIAEKLHSIDVPIAPAPTVTAQDMPASHQLINSSTSNEWYTPPEFVNAARVLMGGIDLDPASNPIANSTIQAKHYYTIDDDGLSHQWHGRVWMNPPYGRSEAGSNQAVWTARLIEEYRAGRVSEAVFLVNAVPGNAWFAPLWDFPICFVSRRIKFYTPDKDAEDTQPTHSNVLVYLGPNIAGFIRHFSQFGPVAGRMAEAGGAVYLPGIDELLKAA